MDKKGETLLSPVFSPEHIIEQLIKASEDLLANPLSGDLIQIREDYDRALDIGLDLGYFACTRATLPEQAPAQGYSSEEYDGA